jgi:Concanavalin A-like lectin/glucanases superfamily
MAIGQQLYDPTGTGQITLISGAGPIVGDPEPVLQFATGGHLTTGTINLGDSGDAAGLGEMTIEAWVKPSTLAGGTNLICCGPTYGGATRQYYLQFNNTGTVSYIVRDSIPTAFTVTSAVLAAANWYHLVGTIQAGSVRLYVNGTQVASTAWSGGNIPSSVGTPFEFLVGDPGGTIVMQIADVAFYRFGLNAARVAAHYSAGVNTGFGQMLSGTRIGAVLDTVSSRAPRRLQAGQRSVTARYMSGQAPLDAIREAVSGEAVDAAFFVAADGALVFLDSAYRGSAPYNTIQVTFGDAGGSELAYDGVTVDYSENYLANKWNVTREGSAQQAGATMTSQDAASIASYFKREQSLTGLPVVADSDSQNIADAMLAKYKQPIQRIVSLALSTADPAVAEAIFRRELGDKIRVIRTPPGGGARLSQDLWIQSISISGSNDAKPWSVQWGVSPV